MGQAKYTYFNDRMVESMRSGPVSSLSDTTLDAELSRDTTVRHGEDGKIIQIQKMVSLSPAKEIVSRIEYDGSWRPVVQVDPDGAVSKTVFDAAGRKEIVSDGLDRKSKTVYDGDGRVLEIYSAYGTPLQQRTRQMTYTPNGLVASIKDARNFVTNYEYDGFDRLIKITYPDSSYEEFQYDEGDNQIWRRTRSKAAQLGTEIYTSFNNYDQPITVWVSDLSAPAVTFRYDFAGRRVFISATDGKSLTYIYDDRGFLDRITDQDGRSVDYEYDSLGNITTIGYPTSDNVHYRYDGLNRVTEVISNRLGGIFDTVATYQYDGLSRPTRIVNGNGVVTEQTYSDASDLLSIDTNFVQGTDARFDYSYTKAHQLYKIAVSDAIYENHPGATNWAEGYSRNSMNQYTNVGGKSYQYDLNGNLKKSGTRLLTHDALNRLTSVTNDGVEAAYSYDPLDRRIRTVIDPNGAADIRDFFYASDAEIVEYDGNGDALKHYIYGAGMVLPIAIVDHDVEGTGGPQSTPPTELYWLHHDQRRSVIAVTDEQGHVLSEGGTLTYTPFGDGADEQPSKTPWRFTGQRYDMESNLHYFRARYYDAHIGRFLEPDPVGYEAQINLYTYSYNSPYAFVDPNGELPVFLVPLAVFAIGAGVEALIQWGSGEYVDGFTVQHGLKIGVGGLSALTAWGASYKFVQGSRLATAGIHSLIGGSTNGLATTAMNAIDGDPLFDPEQFAASVGFGALGSFGGSLVGGVGRGSSSASLGSMQLQYNMTQTSSSAGAKLRSGQAAGTAFGQVTGTGFSAFATGGLDYLFGASEVGNLIPGNIMDPVDLTAFTGNFNLPGGF
mgnify:CR=1 FL=1